MSVTYNGPTYSHGGADKDGYPAVSGNAPSSGRPIAVFASAKTGRGAFAIFCKGDSGEIDVVFEVSGGQLDDHGNPPADEWIDISDGGWTMVPGDHLLKKTHPEMPFHRTRITRQTGTAYLVSYIPLLRVENDFQPVQAQYPPLSSDPTRGIGV